MPVVRLGEFTLDRQIGRGGMAVVWRATRDNGAPAAVKVLTSRHAAAPSYQLALRNEVRAAADLCHPNIIWLLDYGDVSAQAADASRGRLVAGTPWLAMELASSGSLRQRRSGVDWVVLQGWLLELLDGLAHAHARGVIHRDIKPGNLLLTTGSDGTQTLKVTDFGLAYAEGMAQATTASAGTPAYMAPEQRAGQLRDHGPWTDLFAVGRTTLSLLTGSAAGDGLASVQLPTGLEDWLLRMLARDPADRFQRAADAAHALAQLTGPLQWSAVPLAQTITHSTTSAHATLLLDQLTSLDNIPLAPAVQELTPMSPIVAPPMPADAPDAPAPPDAGLHSGLRLTPLRRPALIGRAALRAQLWDALAAARSGGSRAVVLEGVAGVGKSRLACWLTETADAAGTAEVLAARHGPDAPAGDALAAMLSRALGCQGLRGAALHRHLASRLPALDMGRDEERHAVAALISPSEVGAFKSPADRDALTLSLLRRLARDRVLVLWLDDVHWDPTVLRFAARALAGAGPTLLVLTAQTEALAEHPSAARALESLCTDPHAQRLRVGPLPTPAHRRLVAALLGQQDGLLDDVVEKTDGNPLFAVQLIRDWVQRGALQPGPTGLTLADGAQLTVPDGLYAVWADRLARLLAGGAGQPALEIAATLGDEVSQEEWWRACGHAQVPIPPELVERLLEQRLAAATAPQQRWSFAHTMIRESVLRTAAEAGRQAGWHRACADMLIQNNGDAERIGRHLLEAGAPDEAMPWLLEGVRRRRLRGEPEPARALLRQYRRAADTLGWDDRDARRALGWARAARVALHQGALDEARQLSDQAYQHGAPIARIEAATVKGRLAHRRHDLFAAGWCFAEAARLADAAGETVLKARALQQLAGAYVALGLSGAATQAHQDALRLLGDRAEPIDVAMNHYGLASVSLHTKEAGEAVEHAKAACEGYARAGHRTGVATSLNLLGEALLSSGAMEAAAARYQESADRYRRLGMPNRALPTANLGRILLQQGRLDEARAALEAAIAAVEGTRFAPWATRFQICMMPCDAAHGDMAVVAVRLQDAEALAARGVVAPELSQVLRQAGTLLGQQGHDTLAARARAVADAVSVG